jgi:enamine deaminase RidA (YjgF/YER057c/UK114 family)
VTITRSGLTPNFHRIVEHGGILYLSGVVARDGEADMATQTGQVIDRLEELLHSAGSGLDHLLSVTVFVTEMSDKPAMNEVWRARFGSRVLPARATIGVSDLDGPYKIEVSVIAAKL